MDDSSGGKYESVIVFECMDLSIGQKVNVSGLYCVSSKVLRCWDSYKVICGTRMRPYASSVQKLSGAYIYCYMSCRLKINLVSSYQKSTVYAALV